MKLVLLFVIGDMKTAIVKRTQRDCVIRNAYLVVEMCVF